MIFGIIHIIDYLCTTRDNHHLKYNNMKTNKSYLLIAAVLTLLFFLPPTHSLAQNISTGDNKQGVESNTNTASKSENRPKYKIPGVYKEKFESMLKNEFPVIKIDGANSWKFTVEFIDKEMESDWGISKDNQFLFVLHSIHRVIIGKDLYDGKVGGHELFQDFSNVLDSVDACGQRYKEGMLPILKKQSAEYDRRIAEAQKRSAEAQKRSAEAQKRSAEAQKRSAEAQKRSAEAQKRSAEAQKRSAEAIKRGMAADTLGLKEAVKIYNLHVKNPVTNDKDKNELENVKKAFRDIITSCKEYGIDYIAVLRKEVGNEKKVKDILKFFEIE